MAHLGLLSGDATAMNRLSLFFYCAAVALSTAVFVVYLVNR
jgi:hypothetical protein